MAREYDDCCPGKPSDMACIPDNKPRNFRNDIKGCEKFRFSFGGDEMAMNAEMGLYLQFDETDGIPENCPGLEKFTIQKYLNSMEILFMNYLATKADSVSSIYSVRQSVSETYSFKLSQSPFAEHL